MDQSALDIETNTGEVTMRSKPNNGESSRQMAGEALTFIISAFYAKFVVILGIALPITDAISTSEHKTYHVFLIYYIYLYLGSIIFLLYIYLIHVREKTARDVWRQSTYSSGMYINRRSQYVRYGSFYLRMGIIGFGLGSVTYSSLQFAQYFELSSQNGCNHVLKGVKPLLRILFALMQMLFIFSHSNFLDVQKSKIIARFGLMHMIATNLSDWFSVLIEETQHDIYLSAKERRGNVYGRINQSLSELDFQFLNSRTFRVTEQLYKYKFNCLKSNIMESVLNKTESLLGPCTVEYGLLCTVIMVLMWKDDRTHEDKSWSESTSSEHEIKPSGFSIVYSKRQSKFSVDCTRAYKGLFSGLLVLAITITSLIMFFELMERVHFQDLAVLEVNTWETILFAIGAISAVFCIIILRKVNFLQFKKDLELEHLLLLVTQWGVFMYSLFQIIGTILMSVNKGEGLIRIVAPLSAVIQSCCQTTLILDAWRRRCTTSLQMQLKPGRQLITFLLITNIAVWIINRLKNYSSMLHPNQMDFYGVLAWNVITHISIPLVVSYRFMSSVCFYEIWKRVYKVQSVNDKEDPDM